MANGAKLDDIDRRILRQLQADGRMSIQQISDGIGLSPTPVARRVRALEDRGIITGYRAIVDEEAMGYGFSVFVSVRLDRQMDSALAAFETAIGQLPEVVDCWLMTGNRDYLLRVATSGLREFETFLVGRLTRIPGVAAIESSIPLRRIKSDALRCM